jgi:hypothetical protein
MTLHLAGELGRCAGCGTAITSPDRFDPNTCAKCIAERRDAANTLLADLAAASDYRCAWCGDAAAYPHPDWCGQCTIPAEARSDYLWKNSR